MNKAVADAASVPVEKPTSKFTTRQVVVVLVALVALAIGAMLGVTRWNFAVTHEETDDAQVEGHISPVLPRVSGYVTQVLVVDNQRVSTGQALLEIDPKELDLKVAAAQASLQNSLPTRRPRRRARQRSRRSLDAAAERRDGPRAPAQGRKRPRPGLEALQDGSHHRQPADRHAGGRGHSRSAA